MAMDAILQVRMDGDLKRSAEDLYSRMGFSLAEAVRIFARQSVEEQALPFQVRVPIRGKSRKLGIAAGEFTVPEDIDADNDVIAQMFGAE